MHLAPDNRTSSTDARKFGIGQLLMLVAWAGIAMSLVASAKSRAQIPFLSCDSVVVSDSGKYKAAVYYDKAVLYRNDTYAGTIDIGTRSQLKFYGDDTLAVVSTNDKLAIGVHFYSLDQEKFYRSLPLDPNLNNRVLLLDEMILIQNIDKNLNGHFYVFGVDSSAGSKPLKTHVSPTTNMPFDATNNGRYVAFYTTSGWTKEYASSMTRGGFRAGFDLHQNEELEFLNLSSGLQFAPDDSFVITCTDEITAREWPSGQKRWSIPCEPCGTVRFSKQGDKFAVLTGSVYNRLDRQVHIFDSESGKKLGERELNERNNHAYAFSADGKSIWIAAQDRNGGLIKWDIASKKISKRIGSLNLPLRVLYFIALFLVWSVLYAWLFPKTIWQNKPVANAVTFAVIGFFNLAIGCHSCLANGAFPTYLALSLVACGTLFFSGGILVPWRSKDCQSN